MKQFELQTAEFETDSNEYEEGHYLCTARPGTLSEATETFIALEQVKKQTFIAQGYILRVVQDDCMYQNAGYIDIYSYAKETLGIKDDSTVNRLININKRFSAGGYSPLIEDKYMDYKYSALQEIWKMSDEEIEAAGITETTTVAKIREIKKEMREEEPEADEQIPGQTEIADFIPNPIATSQKKSDWKKGIFENDKEGYGWQRSGIVNNLFKQCHKSSISPLSLQGYTLEINRYMVTKIEEYLVFSGSTDKFKVNVERIKEEYEFFLQQKEKETGTDAEEHKTLASDEKLPEELLMAAGENTEQIEESEKDKELNLVSEFISEFYKKYMDVEQHAFINAGEEQKFTTYTEELNYLLLDSQHEANTFIMGNLEVKINFAKMIFIRIHGTYDKWVEWKIKNIWNRMQVMKVLGKLPESYEIGELTDKNGCNAYERVTERLAHVLINAHAQEGEEVPEARYEIIDMIHRIMKDRHIDFFCGDMQYRAEYDNKRRVFLISRYKRNEIEIEVPSLLELNTYDVSDEIMNISGKSQKETYTQQQLTELEEALVLNILEGIEEDNGEEVVNEIFSCEEEFKDFIYDIVGASPIFNFLLNGKTYTYYASDDEMHIMEIYPLTREKKKDVISISLSELYENIKSLWQKEKQIATSQKDHPKTPESRINTLAGGDFDTDEVKTEESEGTKKPESHINTLADGDFEEDKKEHPEEETVTAEVLEKKPQILTLQINLAGYNTMMTKEDRFEQTLRCIGEELKKVNQNNVKQFNFAVDFIGGYTRALGWIKHKKTEERKQEEQRQQEPLPDMKNNDQRREWIGNYQRWPLWIDNEKTKERYYKYDFKSGDAFVIKVNYTNRERYDWKTHKNARADKWEYAQGYILKKDSEDSFTDSRASETQMIEYLKEMKKKG